MGDQIRDFTEGQSGHSGEFRYDGALVGPVQLNLTDFATQVAEFKAAHPEWTGKLPRGLGGPGVCLECSRIGDVQLEVGNLKVSGLDSVTDFSVLNPVNHHSLHNSLTAGNIEISVDVLLRIDGAAPLDGSAAALHVDDRFTVKLDFDDINFLLDVMMKIDHNNLLDLTLGTFVQFDKEQLAGLLAELRIDGANFHLGAATLGLDCAHCSSKILADMASEGATDVTPEISDLLDILGEHITSQNIQRQIELKLADPAGGWHSQLVSAAVSSALKEAPNSTVCEDFDGPICASWRKKGECKNNPDYMLQHCRLTCGVCSTTVASAHATVAEGTSLWILASGAAVALVACATLCRGVAYCCRRRDDSQLTSGLMSEMLLPAESDEKESRAGELSDPVLEERSVSLLCDQRIPRWQRLLLPACLLINIGIFAFGHLHIGASVDIDANAFGDHLRINRFVEFSLGHSLIDMWNGHAYMLFWMVLAFSGVWPYLKLLLLLICWVSPPCGRCCCGQKMRGRMLQLLDHAGTCSLIDLYVLSMCILAFRLHIESPEAANLPDELYLFDVVVTPVAGLYAFLLGVCLSIFLNYAALTLHRQTLRDQGPQNEYNAGRLMPADTPKLSLRQCLSIEWQGKQRSTVTVTATILMLSVMLAGAVCIFITGSFKTSFDFKIYGILQLAIDLGAPEGVQWSMREFSLFSSIIELASYGDLDRYGGWAGVCLIAGVYGCFCFVVPLLVLLFAAVQLLVPMTLHQQKRLFVISEALRAWSALEVFILAVYVGALQMSQVSGFILDGPCRNLNSVINPALKYGLIPDSIVDPQMHTNQCFIIEAQPRSGIYVLVAAATLSCITVRRIASLSEMVIRARYERPSRFGVPRAATSTASTTSTVFSIEGTSSTDLERDSGAQPQANSSGYSAPSLETIGDSGSDSRRANDEEAGAPASAEPQEVPVGVAGAGGADGKE